MSGGDDFDLEAMERRRQRAQQRTESLRDERRGRQRSTMRRTHRRRRAAALASVAVVVCVAAGAWTSLGGGNQRRVPVDASLSKKTRSQPPSVAPRKALASSNHIAMPKIVRGVHISLGIAASTTRMNQFFNLTSKGLNTLEIDVKDENGEVGYTVGAPVLARKIGATKNYYDAKKLIADAHAAGIYVIGRVVCFEDPILSNALPAHAIRTTSGGVWKNAHGLGWTNEYDPFVWNYLINLSKSAATMGFDEIQYDYVRFPTDGNTADAVWPHKVKESYATTIYRFLKTARAAIKPMGVNLSANVFGLAAHEDLNIGQNPTKIMPLLDAISPMAYPSHYGPGSYNLTSPDDSPGATVTFTMGDFRAATPAGSTTEIRPWLQDFSLGRTYTQADVIAQINAAERGGARGWLLWNANVQYHDGALAS